MQPIRFPRSDALITWCFVCVGISGMFWVPIMFFHVFIKGLVGSAKRAEGEGSERRLTGPNTQPASQIGNSPRSIECRHGARQAKEIFLLDPNSCSPKVQHHNFRPLDLFSLLQLVIFFFFYWLSLFKVDV